MTRCLDHARELLESAQQMHLTALLNAVSAGLPLDEVETDMAAFEHAARQILALQEVAG